MLSTFLVTSWLIFTGGVSQGQRLLLDSAFPATPCRLEFIVVIEKKRTEIIAFFCFFYYVA